MYSTGSYYLDNVIIHTTYIMGQLAIRFPQWAAYFSKMAKLHPVV